MLEDFYFDFILFIICFRYLQSNRSIKLNQKYKLIKINKKLFFISNTFVPFQLLTQNSGETDQEEGSESCWNLLNQTMTTIGQRNASRTSGPQEWDRPRRQWKRLRNNKKKSPSWNFSRDSRIGKLAQYAAEEKQYDKFGKVVAAELHQLPQSQTILV